ncbi:hypothetical protein [Methylovulum psychrotolerans]|uniref:Uncharacterized protein n=1 Tax=Methylovulum psychrotolerans TaxID=1704499 RepID=A0A1Z4C1V4_9GAMM|nr:hypothetical protein [Methylovulum psychrotolerans]ASF47499.1 hypothetical protein CEK71_16315 [Methylovulum psychrotolerans]
MKYIEKLKSLALEFRSAIMQCDPETLPDGLQDFPHGACGDTALLLAKYLRDHECGKFDYVLGEREGYTHAWLQQGALIVDITADQFDDNDLAIFVSVDHRWHFKFKGMVENMADLDCYDEYTAGCLQAAYEKILAHVPYKPKA